METANFVSWWLPSNNTCILKPTHKYAKSQKKKLDSSLFEKCTTRARLERLKSKKTFLRIFRLGGRGSIGMCSTELCAFHCSGWYHHRQQSNGLSHATKDKTSTASSVAIADECAARWSHTAEAKAKTENDCQVLWRGCYLFLKMSSLWRMG